MKKSTNIFKICLKFINWGLFIFYSITVLLECISGFRAEILDVGTQTELTALDHSVVSNIISTNGFNVIVLSVLLALILATNIIFSIISKKGFIVAGLTNVVFSFLWIAIYFNNIIQFPSYGYSSLDIINPTSFFNGIMVKVILGIVSFILTSVYIIAIKRLKIKNL